MLTRGPKGTDVFVGPLSERIKTFHQSMFDSDSSDCDFGKSYGNGNLLPYDSLLCSLLKDRFLCDVTIRVQRSSVTAHRVILSATSCFFHDLFKNTESTKQEHDLTDIFINPENLDQIITYIYKGSINITNDNYLSLLTVNKVLGISSLNHHCAQFLLSKLRPLNVLEIWEVAWKFNLEELSNISLIVFRETLCDLLLLNGDVYKLCEEFLCFVLASKEAMAIAKPDSVVRMLSWWLTSQKLQKTERGKKLHNLLNIFIAWRTLSEVEFQTMKIAIDHCAKTFPLVTFCDMDSWLANHYKRMTSIQLSDIDENEEEAIAEILDNIQPFGFRQSWSLLIAEKDIQTVGVYCNANSRWFTMELEDNPLKAIGFSNNSMVFVHNSNTLLLRDVNTFESQNLTSSIGTDESFVKYTGTQQSTFFMHLDNIYSVDAVMRANEKDLFCVIKRWNRERSEWITVLRLNPELSNDILSVSLAVETYYGDDVYLFMTVKRLHANRPSPLLNVKRDYPKESTAFIGKFVTSFRDENSAVCMKPLEMFYVYCINMKDFNYRLIGKRRSEPANLNVNRKIILKDKIIFLLDPDRELESNFRYAYHNRNECLLNCIELFLDGENRWTNLTLRAPFPDVRDISIRKRERICLDCFVTTCKNLLFIGTHWSPHVFQVFMYDISTFVVSSLPPIPLPAIRHMSIYALHTHEPISELLVEETRIVDLMNFHFKGWYLHSWEGTSD